jgi:hypothetical protein
MSPLPVADWQASLDEMESALARTLDALDRCQAGWERAFATTAPSTPVGGLESSLREWDARLLAAAELADSVERELNDKQEAVGRWQESIKLWQAK